MVPNHFVVNRQLEQTLTGILSSMVVAVVCLGFATPVYGQSGSPSDTGYAIKVGEFSVSRDRFDARVEGTFNRWLEKFKRSGKSDTPDLDRIRSEIRRKLSQRYLNKFILDYRIKQTNVTAPDSVVENFWERRAKRAGSEERFLERLQSRGMTRDTFLAKVRERIKRRRYIRQNTSVDTVTEDQIKQFYLDNKEQFQGRPYRRLRRRIRGLLTKKLRERALARHLKEIRSDVPVSTTLSDTGILSDTGSRSS